jgi:hypothetical protein
VTAAGGDWCDLTDAKARSRRSHRLQEYERFDETFAQLDAFRAGGE